MSTVRIPLTQGKYALIDEEDFDLVSQYKWYAHYDGYHWYARSHSARVDGVQVTLMMHAVVLNPSSGLVVDHVSSDGLDNRRENLRFASSGENARNRRAIQGASRFKGVAWNKRGQCWQVRIKMNSKQHWLGYFQDEIDAALAYDEAARRLHGEFCWLNASHFPEILEGQGS